VWCRFVARIWKVGGLELPLRDLDAGIRLGHFRVPGREAARDLLLGGVREALHRIGESRVPPSFGDQMTELCLQALGAEPRRIAAALAHELPSLQEGAPASGGWSPGSRSAGLLRLYRRGGPLGRQARRPSSTAAQVPLIVKGPNATLQPSPACLASQAVTASGGGGGALGWQARRPSGADAQVPWTAWSPKVSEQASPACRPSQAVESSGGGACGALSSARAAPTAAASAMTRARVETTRLRLVSDIVVRRQVMAAFRRARGPVRSTRASSCTS
jgi:hypothetical protein